MVSVNVLVALALFSFSVAVTVAVTLPSAGGVIISLPPLIFALVLLSLFQLTVTSV